MAKYAIVPKRVILIAGVEVTPENPIGTIETDLPIHDVLALVQFKNASLVDLDAPAPEPAPESSEDPSDQPDQTDPKTKAPKPKR